MRANCILLLATGNVGNLGGGANIFRGHDNVQGATDMGLDIMSLPLYYGLTEGAWKHWCARLGGRLRLDLRPLREVHDADQGKMMETPGIPSTRWFDATLLPKDRSSRRTTLKAMIVFGHSANTFTRMPEAAKGSKSSTCWWSATRIPTTWAVLGDAQERHLSAAGCTQFETRGSRTASNRSLQWGEQIVKPIFESKADYEIIYLFAKKLGFADQMFKNIKVENNRRWPRTSCARSIAAAGRPAIAASLRND